MWDIKRDFLKTFANIHHALVNSEQLKAKSLKIHLKISLTSKTQASLKSEIEYNKTLAISGFKLK